ncbi:MAG: DoxX family protein [Gammaproteobacteria bacterium]|jgi:putative oxidoreductase
MNVLISSWTRLTEILERVGDWLPGLFLRVLLGYEFFEAGLNKYRGENWFGSIQDKFPFPFNVVPPEISWLLATWTELVGGAMLVLGLFTRFWTISLIILTIVATAAVHWPESYGSFGELMKGYAISNKGFGNFKLPVIYLVMFMPLLFSGPGKASIDHFLRRRVVGY